MTSGSPISTSTSQQVASPPNKHPVGLLANAEIKIGTAVRLNASEDHLERSVLETREGSIWHAVRVGEDVERGERARQLQGFKHQ